MESKTDLKPGYRWLEEGERIEAGDLWQSSEGNRWLPANFSVGGLLSSGSKYQRKVSPTFTCRLCDQPYQTMKPGNRLIRTNHGNPIGEWECSPACKGFIMTGSEEGEVLPPLKRSGLEAKFDQVTSELERTLEANSKLRAELSDVTETQKNRIENLEKALTNLVAAQTQWAQEKAAHQVKLAVAQEQIAVLEATRGVLHEDLKRAAGERDASRKRNAEFAAQVAGLEVQIRSLLRAGQVSEDKIQELVAKGAGSGWVKYEDRKPTAEDADADGDVQTCNRAGSISYLKFNDTPADNKPWWRPANLPVELSPFMKWYRGTPDSIRNQFRSLDEAEAVWKSIVNPSGETA